MRVLILLAAFAVPGSSAATEPPPPAPGRAGPAMPVRVTADCADASMVHRVDSAPRTLVRTLAEEPPADLALTVLREVDGCHEPVIVRHDIGGLGADGGEPTPSRTPRARPRPAF